MIWKRIDMTTIGSIVQNILHPKSFNNIRIGEKKHSCPKCGNGTNDDDGDDNKDKNDDDDARIYDEVWGW